MKKNAIPAPILWAIWTILLASALSYFWWSSHGDWIRHTPATLLDRDTVRYGPWPMALVYGWLAAFFIALRLSLGSLSSFCSGEPVSFQRHLHGMRRRS